MRHAINAPADTRPRMLTGAYGRAGSAVLFLAAAAALWLGLGASTAATVMRPERHPQLRWAACNRNAHSVAVSTFHPLSDHAAAALVTHEPETRRDNARSYTLDGHQYQAANDYVPTLAQVRAFRQARSSSGQTNVAFNPYYQYVDGRDGLRHPSTDDLIQWAAHKWGIPENWLRAEYVHETYWNQFMLGDATQVSGAWYGKYRPADRIPGTHSVYQSLGITQVRWAPGGALHPGTEPLRWLSTAFNIDYQAATVRFYYDNPQRTRSSWGDGSYTPCQTWNSIGGWYSPYPWQNSGQASYADAVKRILAQRDWESSGFVSWAPSSLPRGLHFR